MRVTPPGNSAGQVSVCVITQLSFLSPRWDLSSSEYYQLLSLERQQRFCTKWALKQLWMETIEVLSTA